MPELNENLAELQHIINDELRNSNVFVNRVLEAAKVYGWSDKQTLAQLVVILGRENNRLQDELLKAEYAKAYPEPVILMSEAKAREILGAVVQADNVLVNDGRWHFFDYAQGESSVTLDDIFKAEELEAIAWWMRNKQ